MRAPRYAAGSPIDCALGHSRSEEHTSALLCPAPGLSVLRFLGGSDATARVGWFVNDLRRGSAAHALFGVGTALAPWHRFIRQDGLTSITRAFVEEDWKRLLQQAGIADARAEICRRFPYRLCVGAFTSG